MPVRKIQADVQHRGLADTDFNGHGRSDRRGQSLAIPLAGGALSHRLHGLYLCESVRCGGGADVNTKHPLGQTPMLAAIVSNDRTIQELLFKHGIDIRTADQYGDTPLHKASAYVELSAVSFLLENGADVNVKNSRGETPLMCARNEKTRRMFAK